MRILEGDDYIMPTDWVRHPQARGFTPSIYGGTRSTEKFIPVHMFLGPAWWGSKLRDFRRATLRTPEDEEYAREVPAEMRMTIDEMADHGLHSLGTAREVRSVEAKFRNKINAQNMARERARRRETTALESSQQSEVIVGPITSPFLEAFRERARKEQARVERALARLGIVMPEGTPLAIMQERLRAENLSRLVEDSDPQFWQEHRDRLATAQQDRDNKRDLAVKAAMKAIKTAPPSPRKAPVRRLNLSTDERAGTAPQVDPFMRKKPKTPKPRKPVDPDDPWETLSRLA